MSFLAWTEAVAGVLGVVFGALLRGPVRNFVRDRLAIRRYQKRLETLEPQADQDARPEAERPVTARELPDLVDNIASRYPYCFFLADLHVRDLRCFPDASLEFRFPGERNNLLLPNVNLLLGDNGSGKSTILRAIAMAALGPVLDSSGFIPFRLVTQGLTEARITGGFVFNGPRGLVSLPADIFVTRRGDFEQVRTPIEGSYWSDLFDESSPSFFVVGYGTNRRVADDPRTDPSLERGRMRRRYQRVASLFDDSVSLVPLGAWLPQADKDRQIEVRDLMARLLPQRASFTGRFEGSEPVFRRSGVDVPLRAMSDGFRSYIGWLGDLLFQMSAVAPTGARLKEIGGIALVDEVDLLLHPSWQRIVVPGIARMLPNVQFIFTTHSPIVAGTLQAGNVIVAREGEHGTSTLERIDAEIHGLSSEQVLLSSYFALETTRAPDALPALEELAHRAVRGDPQATRDYLRALVASEPSDQPKPRP